MNSDSPGVLRAALAATAPVLFGYVPLGMAFGLLFADLGHPWYLATLMAVVVFAGSAQFLAVGLLSAQAGLLEVAVATLALNARHVFYGFSMLGRFAAAGPARAYLIFGLTDETFSLLAATTRPEGARPGAYELAVTALNQSYWVAGCTAGALLGQNLALDTTGLDFALTALFAVLALEQYRAMKSLEPFVLAALAAAVAILLAGPDGFLLPALALATLALLVRRSPA